jgi:hypothetical protein
MTLPSYESNIISNPITHYGTWTPEGWRIHRKQWMKTEPMEVLLSGDGHRTRFDLPSDFVDDIHDKQDPYTDGGIYPAEPRVEYPLGRPRWAISHTFLAYPFADKTLYEMEYIHDRSHRVLETFFRKHVPMEEAVTDSRDGLTVHVKHRPISRVVVGNKAYPFCNSAVRGVWTSPNMRGTNYYTRDCLMCLPSANAVYIRAPHVPVVNCFGLWKARTTDRAHFDAEGNCVEREALEAAGIPLRSPGISSFGYRLCSVFSRFYDAELALLAEDTVMVDRSVLVKLQKAKGVPFQEHQVGYAGWGNWDHMDQIGGKAGFYAATFDFNHNGIVDDQDEEALRLHLGRRYRVNYYSGAYYGWDWLSAGTSLNSEMEGLESVICYWSQGAGYEADTGMIRLFNTPGPGRKVFVEYHYDHPAEAGRDNIRVILRRAVV